MAYSGVVKFLGDTGTEALVYQSDSCGTPDGYRLVRNSLFGTCSAYAVGCTISYTYNTGFTYSDTNWITI